MSYTTKWLSSGELTTKKPRFKSLDSYSIKLWLSGAKYWECKNFVIWETDTGKVICEGENYEDFVKKMGEQK